MDCFKGFSFSFFLFGSSGQKYVNLSVSWPLKLLCSFIHLGLPVGQHEERTGKEKYWKFFYSLGVTGLLFSVPKSGVMGVFLRSLHPVPLQH